MFSLEQPLLLLFQFLRVGVYGTEVTPVPFPNTEVKLCSEDDTWLATAWEIISMPALRTEVAMTSVFYIQGPLAQLVRASGS